jgi:toxin ParE1/3/4
VKFDVLQIALKEIEDAKQWYETEKSGLGDRFESEVHGIMRQIATHPTFATEIEPGYYRRFVRVFPYKVIYKVDPDLVLVLAVGHNHRHPDFWKTR